MIEIGIDFLANTFEVTGSVMIGVAAMRVHHRVLYEHKIDKQVFNIMRVEQKLGVIGIVLLILGYLLQLFV